MKLSTNSFVTGLRCLVCGTTYENGDLHTCPKCGIQGILDVKYDYEKAGQTQIGRAHV
jgi:threonine synthase